MKDLIPFLTSAITIACVFVATDSTHKRIDEIKKEYIERNESLIRDSIKMHDFYQRVQLNYQEKFNLMNE